MFFFNFCYCCNVDRYFEKRGELVASARSPSPDYRCRISDPLHPRDGGTRQPLGRLRQRSAEGGDSCLWRVREPRRNVSQNTRYGYHLYVLFTRDPHPPKVSKQKPIREVGLIMSRFCHDCIIKSKQDFH